MILKPEKRLRIVTLLFRQFEHLILTDYQYWPKYAFILTQIYENILVFSKYKFYSKICENIYYFVFPNMQNVYQFPLHVNILLVTPTFFTQCVIF